MIQATKRDVKAYNDTMSMFRSAFIVNVKIYDSKSPKSRVILEDSNRHEYIISFERNPDMKVQFKNWFNFKFSKGVAQQPTVFKYEYDGEQPNFEMYITKFLNME